ncbi:MAG: SGNH/GDSL hydrolase family protein [Moraxellaceae bacterium]|nr:SGNH/GDSL hydrolase family protein [Pseudobdellovibrionaceae bacterium]
MKWFILFLINWISVSADAAKILQIGDSHTVGDFGTQLYTSLAHHKNVTAARSIGLASASGIQYSSADVAKRTLNYGYIDRPAMKSPVAKGSVAQLSTLLSSEKPDILIVELGDNFAGYREDVKNNRAIQNNVQKILNQIKISKTQPSECFWVGPTWTDWVDENGLSLDRRKNGAGTYYKKSNWRAQQVAAAIKKELDGKCTFVDSMKVMTLSEITTVDGIHCNQATGTVWGQRIYEEIASKSLLLSNGKSKKPNGYISKPSFKTNN